MASENVKTRISSYSGLGLSMFLKGFLSRSRLSIYAKKRITILLDSLFKKAESATLAIFKIYLEFLPPPGRATHSTNRKQRKGEKRFWLVKVFWIEASGIYKLCMGIPTNPIRGYPFEILKLNVQTLPTQTVLISLFLSSSKWGFMSSFFYLT